MAPLNRLAQESSPYLRQHASNPVDWYPWCKEALDRAKSEDKPILLSVGYSACHWCHVMAHESFENEDIAAAMNAGFISIKVDREERPDLDQLYQGVVQLMEKGGGWPLTVFLMPDLRPFFGGTYFPPVERHGMVGFPQLLDALHHAWENDRDQVEGQAKEFKGGLLHLSTYGLERGVETWRREDVVACAEKLEGSLDRENGGFGHAPKFPNPMNLAVMLRAYRQTKNYMFLSGVALTVEKMARGGIYDQLGGGFHRYSVDEGWRIPHFEKMLYDNAQLIHLYTQIQQIQPQPLWQQIVEESVAYVEREMTSPQGGFYSAQDADSEGAEGKYFAWTPHQIDQALPAAQATLIKSHYRVTTEGNFEGNATVFQGREISEENRVEFNQARKILFEEREKRIKPSRDEKILSGWNGLMIRGLALASRVFERPEWARTASNAADFVLSQMFDQGYLVRSVQDSKESKAISSPPINGFVEDYGDLAAGLTALYQATFDAKYLEVAEELVDQAVERFWDDRLQAYLLAPRDQADLLCPLYSLHDHAYPSGASTLTEAQLALAAMTGHERHAVQAFRYLKKAKNEAVLNPFGLGHLILAADDYLEGMASVTVVGPWLESQPLIRTVQKKFSPSVAVVWLDPAQLTPKILASVATGKKAVEGKATAYLCRHFVCEAPITSPGALREKL